MSSDLSIPAIGPPSQEPLRERAGPPAGKLPDAAVSDAASGKPLPNPALRLDPGLGIVVIEFRDEAGAVRNSIPTEQQLQAYRTVELGAAAVKGSSTEAD